MAIHNFATVMSDGGGTSFTPGDVKLNTEDLDTLSESLSSASSKITGYNEKIYEMIGELEGNCWSGPSYKAFVEKATTQKKVLEDIAILLGSFSKKIGEFSSDGTTVVGNVKMWLNNLTTMTVTPYIAGSGSTAGASGGGSGNYDDVSVHYGIDTSGVTKAQQVEDQAHEAMSALEHDIDRIESEMVTLETTWASIEAMRESGAITDEQYNAYKKDYEDRKAELQRYLNEYTLAYEQFSLLMGDEFGYGASGKITGASEWWNNDVETALEGAAEANAILASLTPTSLICETTSFSGLLAYEEGYYTDTMLAGGPHVSNMLMDASFNASTNSGTTYTPADDSGVTFFNSESYLLTGMQNLSYYGDTTSDHVLSQTDVYYMNNYYRYESPSGGVYDSVRIDNGNGEYTYMTYGEYMAMTSGEEI